MKKSFITVTPDTGQNNRTLSVKADINETGVTRYDIFKVEGGGITKSVSIEQDPSPYIYIDCGYIFSNANIQEPYEIIYNGNNIDINFNVRFANFILSQRSLFIIKNIFGLQVEINNAKADYIDVVYGHMRVHRIYLDGSITSIIPNFENTGTALFINTLPDKISEIITKINSACNEATENVKMTMVIELNGGQGNLTIRINVIL